MSKHANVTGLKSSLTAIILSMVIACAMSFTALAKEPNLHKAGYRWSTNVVIAPPEAGKQRGETALVTDGKDRVWLSYLDADYKQLPNGKWIAFPRKVVLLSSMDQGRSFTNPQILSAMGAASGRAPPARCG